MIKSNTDTLTLSRRVLRVLTKLNLIMGALILTLLIASLIAESWVMRALGVRPAPSNTVLLGMRLIINFSLPSYVSGTHFAVHARVYILRAESRTALRRLALLTARHATL